MSTVASQITSLAFVYSTVYSGTDQRKHQSSASLAFVQGIHRGPVNSLHKWPVTRKMFPFDDVITNKMNAAGPHCISQYDWLWLWLSAINQKAISWTNVDQIQLYEVTKGKWVDKLFKKKIFSAFGQQFHYMVNDIKSSLMHNESPVSVCAYFISFFYELFKTTGKLNVCSAACSDEQQKIYQSCTLLALCVENPLVMGSSYEKQIMWKVSLCHGIIMTWLLLTHWGRGKMDAIFQTTFSSEFSWMKMYKFCLQFHWNLFLCFELTIYHHWFR